MPTAISIAVVARNGAAGLQDCLQALGLALYGLDTAITVVMNDTTADSAGAVRRFANRARIPCGCSKSASAKIPVPETGYVHAPGAARPARLVCQGYVAGAVDL